MRRADGSIVWQFGITKQPGNTDDRLNTPTDADLLPSGNILICDAGNKRLIEVDRQTRAIVYRFEHPLEDLRDADRITENISDRNKTLVIAKNLPVSQSIQPLRLAYFNETFLSERQTFLRPVNYNTLHFDAVPPPGTRVLLQLRSASTSEGLATARWYGPTSTTDFYTAATTAINPIHNGDLFYQFRVSLETTSPLLTPKLLKLEVDAHYFDDQSDGVVTSKVIRDSLGFIITNWQSLIVNTILPDNIQLRSRVEIIINLLDEQGKVLPGGTLDPLSTITSTNTFDNLTSKIPSLRERQAVRLQARLSTNNSSVTPRLDDWRLEWQNTNSTPSSLRFTDSNGQEVSYYRAPSIDEFTLVGTVFLTLQDINLLPIENRVDLQIRAQRSGDVESAFLTQQPSGLYILRPGFPALVTDSSPSRAGVLEVRDRDTLTVRYKDPTDPADSSSASVVMIRLASGSIRVENTRGARVDTVALGDTLHVRVLGETDNDFSPARDSIKVTVLNNTGPRDREKITLYEVANRTTGTFNTGEFLSRVGIPIFTVTSGNDDGKLQVVPGDQILAEYVDNTTLQVTVQVRPQPQDTTIFILAGNRAFDFFVAPNPYNAKLHEGKLFRLAAIANSGDMSVDRIEIYNLAGMRIRTIPGNTLRFSGQQIIARRQPAFADRWWDFRTDDGALAAAGTYWAKFYATLTDQDGTRAVTSLRKFIIIQ
jgi:hypothetical protein